MNPWYCFTLIALAGSFGGFVNALLTDKELTSPKLIKGIWCPGSTVHILLGAAAAVASWSLYGSGAAIDLAKQTVGERTDISLTFSALTGAFLVGVGGAKWIANEVEKKILKESIREATHKEISPLTCDEILQQPSQRILELIGSCKEKQPSSF
jgi:hypothetical protein